MYYFAYGLNLHPSRNNGWQLVRLHKLENFQWLINERGVSTIVPSDCSFTWGAIYLISDDDLYDLDTFEAYPKWYDRKTFTVEHRGKPIKVTYYFDVASSQRGSVVRLGYIDKILESLKQLNFPQEWIEYVSEYK